MFNRKDKLPEPAEAYPGQWVLRDKGQDRATASFDEVRQWFAEGKIPPTCQIFEPTAKAWYPPEAYVPAVVQNIIITTTHQIDGCRIEKYMDVESVEIVIGTGPWSELTSGFADFFGARSSDFEKKLQWAKKSALQKLRFVALQRGANAVIGIDLDYTEFTGNRIGVVANGTLVLVKSSV
jgi:uncharacterized protein YbjQ (UPF0145 family)